MNMFRDEFDKSMNRELKPKDSSHQILSNLKALPTSLKHRDD